MTHNFDGGQVVQIQPPSPDTCDDDDMENVSDNNNRNDARNQQYNGQTYRQQE